MYLYDIAHYCQQADTYLMTSMSVGFPRTLIGAIACGLPVLCTYIPQLVPAVTECGMVIPKKDTGVVAKCLEKLWRDCSLRGNLGRRARTYAVEHYSLEKMAKETERVFQTCHESICCDGYYQ